MNTTHKTTGLIRADIMHVPEGEGTLGQPVGGKSKLFTVIGATREECEKKIDKLIGDIAKHESLN